MPSLLNNAKHWMQRAQETRRLADSVEDAEAKRTLIKIAEEYERLAQRAAKRDDDGDTNGTANGDAKRM